MRAGDHHIATRHPTLQPECTQTILHDLECTHQLDQRQQNFGLLEEFVECMANNGADVCGQAGLTLALASGLDVEGIRQHFEMFSEKYDVPFHMAGHAMVEVLCARNIEKVALNSVDHWPGWRQGTVNFWKEALY